MENNSDNNNAIKYNLDVPINSVCNFICRNAAICSNYHQLITQFTRTSQKKKKNGVIKVRLVSEKLHDHITVEEYRNKTKSEAGP